MPHASLRFYILCFPDNGTIELAPIHLHPYSGRVWTRKLTKETSKLCWRRLAQVAVVWICLWDPMRKKMEKKLATDSNRDKKWSNHMPKLTHSGKYVDIPNTCCRKAWGRTEIQRSKAQGSEKWSIQEGIKNGLWNHAGNSKIRLWKVTPWKVTTQKCESLRRVCRNSTRTLHVCGQEALLNSPPWTLPTPESWKVCAMFVRAFRKLIRSLGNSFSDRGKIWETSCLRWKHQTCEVHFCDSLWHLSLRWPP